MNNENALYEVAKKITLEAGLPYTDPRTGKTTHPKPKPSYLRALEKAADRVYRRWLVASDISELRPEMERLRKLIRSHR